ncbi:MAG: phosphoglycerate mutase, partial [Myxococcota bacterium]
MEEVRSAGRLQLFYLILDGLGDEPCSALGGRTPLEVARIPHLGELARRGRTYRLDMRDRTGDVSTSYGQFALFGYGDDAALPERGPVEAAGIGVDLAKGDVAFRANWATFDGGWRIVDRRAGRIREGAVELARALDGMSLGDGVQALVRAGTEHRVALVLRGPGLGAGVSDSDPMHTILEPVPPLRVTALDPGDVASQRTVACLARFQELSRPILCKHPVNLRRKERGQRPA